MDQKEIDTIEQLASDMDLQAIEESTNYPLGDVQEYSFQLGPRIQLSFIELRAHAASAYRHIRTILKTSIPPANLQIVKVSWIRRIFKYKSGSPYRIQGMNKKLIEEVGRNKILQRFIMDSDDKFSVRTVNRENQSILELRYDDFIFSTDSILKSALFMEELRDIISAEEE